jgi:hypothetical protein
LVLVVQEILPLEVLEQLVTVLFFLLLRLPAVAAAAH